MADPSAPSNTPEAQGSTTESASTAPQTPDASTAERVGALAQAAENADEAMDVLITTVATKLIDLQSAQQDRMMDGLPGQPATRDLQSIQEFLRANGNYKVVMDRIQKMEDYEDGSNATPPPVSTPTDRFDDGASASAPAAAPVTPAASSPETKPSTPESTMSAQQRAFFGAESPFVNALATGNATPDMLQNANDVYLAVSTADKTFIQGVLIEATRTQKTKVLFDPEKGIVTREKKLNERIAEAKDFTETIMIFLTAIFEGFMSGSLKLGRKPGDSLSAKKKALRTLERVNTADLGTQERDEHEKSVAELRLEIAEREEEAAEEKEREALEEYMLSYLTTDEDMPNAVESVDISDEGIEIVCNSVEAQEYFEQQIRESLVQGNEGIFVVENGSKPNSIMLKVDMEKFGDFISDAARQGAFDAREDTEPKEEE